MDSQGNILSAQQVAAMDESARKAHKLVPIPPDDLPQLRAMNRKQRRAWHARQRKANKRK